VKRGETIGRNDGRQTRVLVVDDDDDFRGALRAALIDLGYTCVAAKAGDEAWWLHRSIRFDVVICDWMMPGMDGLELCRRIRLHSGDRYTYLILMTGLADKAHVVQGLREGADEYLTKPFDLDLLQARLVSARRVIDHERKLFTRNALLQRNGERAFQAARADALTRLGNRLRLDEDLAALAGRASRYGHRYSLALSDVDHFKRYNDRYGHLAGDAALRRVAEAMHESLRAGDVLYRFGGEEFVAILPEQALADAAIAMERVGAAVARLRIAHEDNRPFGVLTISTGVAELVLNSGSSQEDWLRRADVALYRAKRQGRNRVIRDQRDAGRTVTPVPGASCTRVAVQSGKVRARS
jgi:diguanylate cyclase (GGDEF)-like protein